MTDIVAWTSAEDNRPFSANATGEDDAWAPWIPRAWHAVADPEGRHPAPERPIAMGGPGHGRVLNEHAELLAWWGPFTHLVMFGLGWPNPALGISRWQEMKARLRIRSWPLLRDGGVQSAAVLELGPFVRSFCRCS